MVDPFAGLPVVIHLTTFITFLRCSDLDIRTSECLAISIWPLLLRSLCLPNVNDTLNAHLLPIIHHPLPCAAITRKLILFTSSGFSVVDMVSAKHKGCSTVTYLGCLN